MSGRQAACPASTASHDFVCAGQRRASGGRHRCRLQILRNHACPQVLVAFVRETRPLLPEQLALRLTLTEWTMKACRAAALETLCGAQP